MTSLLSALRTTFIGEVDLPECKFPPMYLYLIFRAGEEPLLKEPKR